MNLYEELRGYIQILRVHELTFCETLTSTATVTTLILLTVLASHGFNAIPLVRKLRNGVVPTIVDFTAISFILYFDLGLLCEATGTRVEPLLLSPFFDSPPSSQVIVAILIATAPALLRIGSFLSASGPARARSGQRVQMLSNRHSFYIVAAIVCSASAITGYHALSFGDNIWQMREQIALKMGPLITTLYLPLYALGFYLQMRDASTVWGRVFTVFLILASVLSTVAIGERTLILLPLVIFAFAPKRIKVRTIGLIGVAAACFAAMLLPFFKWQYASSDSISDRIRFVINEDFYRAPVMVQTVGLTEPAGTRVMSYTGSGYVYAFLFPVPRSVVPFKGYSTATSFTAYLDHSRIDLTYWQLGISALDEILLNFGYIFFVPGVLLYGAAFGLLERMVGKVPTLRVPARLAAIWFLGYDLPALLLTFGLMAVTGALMFRIWGTSIPEEPARSVETRLRGERRLVAGAY